jgi:hypothetical protein
MEDVDVAVAIEVKAMTAPVMVAGSFAQFI